MLRVSLQNYGYIGFIDILPDTTLKEARQLIQESFDDITYEFQFLFEDDVPINLSQELTPKAIRFYPCLHLRKKIGKDSKRKGIL